MVRFSEHIQPYKYMFVFDSRSLYIAVLLYSYIYIHIICLRLYTFVCVRIQLLKLKHRNEFKQFNPFQTWRVGRIVEVSIPFFVVSFCFIHANEAWPQKGANEFTRISPIVSRKMLSCKESISQGNIDGWCSGHSGQTANEMLVETRAWQQHQY